MNLDAGAALLNGAANLSLGGVIGGGGSLAQTGSGTTTLLSANTFTGGTTRARFVVAGNARHCTGR